MTTMRRRTTEKIRSDPLGQVILVVICYNSIMYSCDHGPRLIIQKYVHRLHFRIRKSSVPVWCTPGVLFLHPIRGNCPQFI